MPIKSSSQKKDQFQDMCELKKLISDKNKKKSQFEGIWIVKMLTRSSNRRQIAKAQDMIETIKISSKHKSIMNTELLSLDTLII